MSFELRTELQKVQDKELLVLFMRVNSTNDDDWFNVAVLPSMFKDKQSAWLTLKPTIITLLNGCYPEDANVRLT